MTWLPQYAAFRDRLAAGIDTRFYTVEYLDHMLMTGRAAIWFGDNSALVCEIKAFPSGVRAAACVVAAGDAQEIVEELTPQAEAWGKANGCAYAMLESRAGWGKKFRPHGYEPFQTAFAKEL
jgi:hypothetical protein